MAASAVDAAVLTERLGEARRSNKLNLSYLDIQNFTGALVRKIQETCPTLQELDLRSNALSELPDELAELKTVKALKLNFNKFATIPSVVAHLPRLQILEMSGNLLANISDTIVNLTTLREVDFSGNRLTDINPKLFDVEQLTAVNFENNEIERIPDEIANAKNLQRLDMSTNRLDKLPDAMGKLAKLVRCDVTSNLLVTIPPILGNLRNLRHFDCRHNELREPYKSKCDADITSFLDFLKEEEERERLEEIERLKPIGIEVGNWVEFKVKVNTDAEEGTNKCYLRDDLTLTACGPTIGLVFGGTRRADHVKCGELWYINTDRMYWELLSIPGGPTARDGHSACYCSTFQCYVVFGGRSGERKRLNDIYVLDMSSENRSEWAWSKPNVEGNPPSPREHAHMSMWGDQVVVFGGSSSGARLNDFFVFDLETSTWSAPAISGNVPGPRQNVAAFASDTHFFIHGGKSNFILNDMFVLDLNTFVWSELTTAGRVPPPRFNHSMLVVDGKHVYVFGGCDELGGNVQSLHMLEVLEHDLHPPTEQKMGAASMAGAVKQTQSSEWTEMDTELVYNESRIAAFRGTMLLLFQHGSKFQNAVRGGVDDSALAISGHFYDTCKTSNVHDLGEKVLDEESMRPPNAKMARIKHTMRTKTGSMPHSLKSVTPKEQKMLDYVDDYRRTFIELYPTRRPLLLFPPNECGVNKFICTTIRPTQLPFLELYTLESCVDYMASFMKFELLEDPRQYPSHIPSPWSVLSWQAGDAFDIAIALVSVLIGVGYDAYVCIGYAPKAVTKDDQSGLECPILEAERAAAAAGPKEEETFEKASKYLIHDAVVLESAFDKAQLAEAVTAGGATSGAAGDAHDDDGIHDAGAEDSHEDPMAAMGDMGEYGGLDDERLADGQRVHAWVLVLGGRREVPENIFVEPTTGRRYGTNDSPYEGIEAVFNSENYWVNMQRNTIGGHGKQLQGISFELSDSAKWEAVIQEVKYEEDKRPKVTAAVAAAAADADGEGEPPATPATDTLVPKTPASSGKPGTAGTMGTEPLEPVETLFMPDLPASWVPKLVLSREAFDVRCPRGARTVMYKKCLHETYALFGECAQWNGLISRLTIYTSKARTAVEECREEYHRRKDRLKLRITFPEKDMVIERFDPGSSFGIKELVNVRGKRRVATFYRSARLDGLIQREELMDEAGGKMIETFVNRDDRLNYRSVSYFPPLAPAAPKESDKPVNPNRLSRKKKVEEPLVPIRKMTEKYAEIPGDVDVTSAKAAAAAAAKGGNKELLARRTFYVAQGQIKLMFHYGTNRISASSRHYSKDGQTNIVTVDPLEEAPKDSELYEEFQTLVEAERKCMNSIRESEKEVQDMVATRSKEEQNIVLLSPYYDIVRCKTEESEEEEETGEVVESDYLSPFLPPLIAGTSLSKAQAFEVREKCLRALQDRLIERANIIQARHDEQTALLAKRQATFQRDRDTMSRHEEEEYERECDAALFRIQILEQRLKRHEEQALQRYYDLDAKLRADPRLQLVLS